MMRDACGGTTALQKPKELTVMMLIHDFWRPFVASSIKEADFAEVRLPRPPARSAALLSYSQWKGNGNLMLYYSKVAVSLLPSQPSSTNGLGTKACLMVSSNSPLVSKEAIKP